LGSRRESVGGVEIEVGIGIKVKVCRNRFRPEV
jgi:hypothetical protein